MTYAYGPTGRRTGMTVLDNGATMLNVSYAYDTMGRLTQISPVGGGSFAFAYDGAGRRSALTYPSGAVATYGYDARGRLTSLTHKTSTASTIASFTYTYDNTVHRLTKTEPNKSHSYTFDGVYRLTGSTPNPVDPNVHDLITEDFTFDAVGNRLTGPDALDAYAYGTGNRLLSLTLTEPFTVPEDFTYTYDFENRLTGVVRTVGGVTTTVTFKYGPFGRRIEKSVNTTENGQSVTRTYTYVYDNEDIVLEYLTETICRAICLLTTV